MPQVSPLPQRPLTYSRNWALLPRSNGPDADDVGENRFFSNAKSKPGMAAQIDAGINFFLWLTGRKYDSDSFRRTYSQRCPGPHSKKAAPLSEMYAYVKKEREEQR